jgi:hypothetical protein
MDALDRVSEAVPFTPFTAAISLLLLSIVLFSFWWDWKQSRSKES